MERTAPMWLVNDQLYHYSDKERAERLGEVKEVEVTLPRDYFISTVQHVSDALEVREVEPCELCGTNVTYGFSLCDDCGDKYQFDELTGQYIPSEEINEFVDWINSLYGWQPDK